MSTGFPDTQQFFFLSIYHKHKPIKPVKKLNRQGEHLSFELFNSHRWDVFAYKDPS